MASNVNEKDLLLAGFEDFLRSLPHEDCTNSLKEKLDRREVVNTKCKTSTNASFIAFIHDALKAEYEKRKAKSQAPRPH